MYSHENHIFPITLMLFCGSYLTKWLRHFKARFLTVDISQAK